MSTFRKSYAAETGALEDALTAGDFDTALACVKRRQDLLRAAITQMPEDDTELRQFLADAEAHNVAMITRLELLESLQTPMPGMAAGMPGTAVVMPDLGATPTAAAGDDFGGFGAAAPTASGGDDAFGDFGGGAANAAPAGGDDFGDFGGFGGAANAAPAGGDDFGVAGFGGAPAPPQAAADDGFAAFGSAPAPPACRSTSPPAPRAPLA